MSCDLLVGIQAVSIAFRRREMDDITPLPAGGGRYLEATYEGRNHEETRS
jgi:hypothetical protein